MECLASGRKSNTERVSTLPPTLSISKGGKGFDNMFSALYRALIYFSAAGSFIVSKLSACFEMICLTKYSLPLNFFLQCGNSQNALPSESMVVKFSIQSSMSFTRK